MSRQDRNIHTPADLIGAKVMMADDQSAAQLRAVMINEGINPARVQVVPHSWSFDDLITGKVDAISAYSTVEPAQLRARGVEPSLLRSADYGVDFYGDTLFTTKEEIAAHPKRVAAFVRASLKGWDYALAHPEWVSDLILKMDGVATRGVTREILLNEAAAMRPFILPDVVEIGHMNLGRWQHIAETFRSLGMGSPAYSLDDFVFNPRPTRELELVRWTIWLGCAGLLVLGFGACWNVQIQRQVRRRTQELTQEVSRRQDVENEFRANEERFRLMFVGAATGIVVTTPAGRFLKANPAYCSMVDYCEEELKGMDFPSLIHPDWRTKADDLVKQMVGGTVENFVIEISCFRKDGAMVWVRASASLVGPLAPHKVLREYFTRASMKTFLGQIAGSIICETGEFTVYRPLVDGGEEPVLVKVPSRRRPALETIRHLEHEYRTAQGLNSSVIVRPLRLEQDAQRIALVLEDDGAQADVADLLGDSMEVGLFLKIAIGTTVALTEIHQHDLIHKDIKPQNLLFNPETGQVRITGFGIASGLPRERQVPEPPEVLSGTLAYMAPEQTGRMNRSIDSRSDLYSLGVTFYEMLTGRLPFAAADPMEWVHCHIAQLPAPPSERVAEIPEPLSAIVMKLLSKPAEARYQTATGLKADLLECLGQWESNGRIDSFPLGTQDTPDRLLIPEKLYGREREIDAIIAAFNRMVASGTPELVLVSGYSGIGKSSVVNELRKVLAPPRGLFAAGKFDQYKRDIPYAPLAQAFHALIRQILGKSEAEMAQWRDALKAALDQNGQLIVNLIPELELVIGKQPPVPDLAPQDTLSRFQMVFRRFLGVFARPEHPLALFLDDLQWLDAATLDLFEYLITEPGVRNLLLLGAYRDNEVGPLHRLMRRMKAIRKTEARIQEIVLAPIVLDNVCRLIVDSLHCEQERAEPLAQLIYAKTGGNPFFAIQFFTALAEERLLAFNPDAAAWNWDLAQIRSKGFTDNVVDLMLGKLKRLPDTSQDALKQLACLGNVAEIATLTLVHGVSEEAISTALWEAERTGLIVRMEGSYMFLHDRIQEAAYALIPEGERAAAHLRIGRVLALLTAPEEIEEKIFKIVNQLNRGAALITAWNERKQLAELNLIAGKRAKASTAYFSALNYLVLGAGLLAEDSWQRQHALAYALELNRAECELLIGALAQAEQRLAALSARAVTTMERASVTCLRTDLYTILDQGSRAIAVGLDYLQQLGIAWSPHPTEDEARREYERIWSQLGSRTIESLIDLPLMSDPVSLATLDVLSKMATPALYTDANLYLVVICRLVNLSLEHGNCDASCFAYEWLAMAAGARFGEYRAAYSFGRLGYELVEQRGLKRFQARTYLIFGGLIIPWTRHVKSGRDLLRRSFEAANKIGDLTYAAYSCDQLNTNMLAAGDSLVETQREIENGLAFARTARFGLVIDLISSALGLVRTLRGLTWKFGSFDDKQFDEREIERRFASNSDLALAECWYSIRKLQARYFAGDYPTGLKAASTAQRLLWTSVSRFERAEYHFYGALSHAASCNSASGEQRWQHIEALTAHYRQLKMWSDNCPENFENRAALAAAEIARIEGRELDAERLYEQAIRSARENGFIQNEGVANELAAKFYLDRGFETTGHAYMQEARYCYVRWGANGKVRQLDERYPWLPETKRLETAATTDSRPEQLDLMTVVKAQQAISSEILLERLAETLLRIVVENAGAQKASLFVESDTVLSATVCPGQAGISIQFHWAALRSATDVCAAILLYVKRTGESVLLRDASSNAGEFSGDEYLKRISPKSVLCIPIMRQTKLIGVLYLENNLTAGSFTPNHCSVLEMLASQAAISLETAKLYADLQQSQENLQSQTRILQSILDSMGDGVIVANEQGEFLLFNPAAEEILGIGAIKTGLEHWAKDYGMYLPDQRTLYPAEELPLSKALRGESVDKTEVFVQHPKCPQGVWLSVTARPLTDEAGVAHGGVAVFSDFTARKKSEEELGKLNAELEHKVEERTTQLRMALEKETLLRREIHHRVKNNLQVISSLLFLQSIHASDAGTREVLRECESRARSLALVHEKLYQSDELTKIEFAVYLTQLVASMFESYRISPSSVKLKIKAEGVFLGLDAAIPCGLIITELVSNAIKYAFSGGRKGELAIDLQSVGGGILKLSVRDNGAGLPEGFDPRKVQTLGVKLVCDLTAQLNGTVEFKNEGGTVVSITFPEPAGSEHE